MAVLLSLGILALPTFMQSFNKMAEAGPSALSQLAATFAATGGACVFVFFSLLACQGILLNILPSRLFTRASLFVQATVFVTTLGLLPFIGRQPDTAAWWPPVWFLGLWE